MEGFSYLSLVSYGVSYSKLFNIFDSLEREQSWKYWPDWSIDCPAGEETSN